jgi:hypothetical protein
VNMYRMLGDAVATSEARDLAEQLVAWHDAMVTHVRAVTLRHAPCGEGCPHEQAQLLWARAIDAFGSEAGKLAFLRRHGERAIPAAAGLRAEARA